MKGIISRLIDNERSCLSTTVLPRTHSIHSYNIYIFSCPEILIPSNHEALKFQSELRGCRSTSQSLKKHLNRVPPQSHVRRSAGWNMLTEKKP